MAAPSCERKKAHVEFLGVYFSPSASPVACHASAFSISRLDAELLERFIGGVGLLGTLQQALGHPRLAELGHALQAAYI